MELSRIIPHIEALIFASDKPLVATDIVELINNAFGFMEERISLEQVETCIDGIREKYNAEFYPFEIRESGGGYQFLTKKDYYKTVAQLNGDKFLKRLSNAALETLAIIAYKQPITKGEVEAIRGVNSDYSVQKLLEKELIIISGRNEELPGKPLVYCTSKSFMDYFGINSTDDLPKIKEVLTEQTVQGTLINEGTNQHVEEDENTSIHVADDGSLIVQPVAENYEGEISTDENPESENIIESKEHSPEYENDLTSDDQVNDQSEIESFDVNEKESGIESTTATSEEDEKDIPGIGDTEESKEDKQ